MGHSTLEIQNNLNSPYWAMTFFLFTIIGLSTIWIDLGDFWRGCVLDMTGPSWTYILFRGLYTAKANNIWTRFFTPKRTVIILIIACLIIETLQYFKIYTSTFDPWNVIAYSSILIPIFLIDLRSSRETTLYKKSKLEN